MTRSGSRELGLAVAVLVTLSRGADGAALWAAAALAVAAVAAATLQLLGEWRFWRAGDRLALPVLAAFAAVGLAHLVPAWPWLAVLAPAGGALVAWAVAFELPDRDAADLPAETTAPSGAERGSVPGASPEGVAARIARAEDRALVGRIAALGLAFLAFAAVGGIVPAGLAGDRVPLTGVEFVAIVLLDAAIGALAGMRIIALTGLRGRAALVPANHYLALSGHLGAIVRFVGVPRLLGPALLTLALYLWTQYRESPTPVYRTPRLVRESALFALAAAGVVAWGLVQR